MWCVRRLMWCGRGCFGVREGECGVGEGECEMRRCTVGREIGTSVYANPSPILPSDW